jgi:hypothetical protein
MHGTRRASRALTLIALVAVPAALSLPAYGQQDERHYRPPEYGAAEAGAYVQRAGEYVAAVQYVAVMTALDQIGQYVTWEAAQEAQAEAAREWAAAHPPSPPAPLRPANPSVSGGGGGACGGATNGADQFIHRESGGNPQAVNPSSGAYGCWQVLPSTWASACGDINGGHPQGATVAQQAACASRLPLSAWNL